jgi:hypothetical protein
MQFVEYTGGTLDDIEVTQSDRVERAGDDGDPVHVFSVPVAAAGPVLAHPAARCTTRRPPGGCRGVGVNRTNKRREKRHV